MKQDALGDEAFIDAWNAIRDQDPPPTRVLAISHAENLKSAIHDRWIICNDRGLRIGTSYNSIGTGKLYEISPLSDAQVISVSREICRFENEENPIDNLRISYMSFKIQPYGYLL